MAAKQAYSSWAVKYISPMRKQYRKRINPLPAIAGFVCFFLLIFSAGSTTEIKGDPPSQTVFKVLNSFPHDPTAFTQGFAYRDGFLYESTGLYGESSLRRTNPATGEVTAKINLSPKFFGEGLTILGDSIYQLTWKSGRGFIYDRKTLGRKGSFTYSTEGWGLTDDGTSLIMSDGTEKLYFLSPGNFKVTKVLRVREGGSPVRMLNELEYAGGKIYCNIWALRRYRGGKPRDRCGGKTYKPRRIKKKTELSRKGGSAERYRLEICFRHLPYHRETLVRGFRDRDRSRLPLKRKLKRGRLIFPSVSP